MQSDERDLQDENQAFRVKHYPSFFSNTEDGGSTGSRQTNAALRDISRSKLSREHYRGTQQSGSSLRSAVIHFVSSKRLLTGLNCYSREGSSRQKNSQRSGRNVTN